MLSNPSALKDPFDKICRQALGQGWNTWWTLLYRTVPRTMEILNSGEKKAKYQKKKKHQLTLMVTSAIQPVPMHLISNLPFKSQLTRFKAVVNFSWPPKEERFHPKTVQLRLRSYQKYLKKENRKGLKCEGDSHVFPYNFNVTNVGNY